MWHSITTGWRPYTGSSTQEDHFLQVTNAGLLYIWAEAAVKNLEQSIRDITVAQQVILAVPRNRRSTSQVTALKSLELVHNQLIFWLQDHCQAHSKIRQDAIDLETTSPSCTAVKTTPLTRVLFL